MEKDGYVYFCECKATAKQPMRDAGHNTLVQRVSASARRA